MAQDQQTNDFYDFVKAPLEFIPPVQDVWYRTVEDNEVNWTKLVTTQDDTYSIALLKHFLKIFGKELTLFIWSWYKDLYRFSGRQTAVQRRTLKNIRVSYTAELVRWQSLLSMHNLYYKNVCRGFCMGCGEPSLSRSCVLHRPSIGRMRPKQWVKTNKYGLAIMGICMVCINLNYTYFVDQGRVEPPDIIVPKYETVPTFSYRIVIAE